MLTDNDQTFNDSDTLQSIKVIRRSLATSLWRIS